jgi:hypothetical protein
MSTIRVNNLQNTSTTDGGISINASGHVTVDGVAMPSAGPLSNRNLVINGAMQVAQRGTSISLTQNGAFTLDRYYYHTTGLDTYTCTVAKSSTAPAGFTSSFQLTTGTAESLGADEFVYISQKIEAQNLQHLQFGTAQAQNVTLSFWVRSSQTGTFGVNLYQSDGNDLVNSTYTISTANTWERKTITFPGNTAASPANDNGEGLRISWILAAGTNFSGTSQTTWGAYSDAAWGGDHAQNGVATTASATWYLTGVQLEVGSVATPFEHRSFGDELARCQRYFARSYSYGTATGTANKNGAVLSTAYTQIAYASAGTAFFPVEMRAVPSVTIYSTHTGTAGQVAADSTDGVGSAAFMSTKAAFIRRSNNNSGVGANVYIGAHYVAEAEL